MVCCILSLSLFLIPFLFFSSSLLHDYNSIADFQSQNPSRSQECAHLTPNLLAPQNKSLFFEKPPCPLWITGKRSQACPTPCTVCHHFFPPPFLAFSTPFLAPFTSPANWPFSLARFLTTKENSQLLKWVRKQQLEFNMCAKYWVDYCVQSYTT